MRNLASIVSAGIIVCLAGAWLLYGVSTDNDQSSVQISPAPSVLKTMNKTAKINSDGNATSSNAARSSQAQRPQSKDSDNDSELMIDDITLVGIFYAQQWQDSLTELRLPLQTVKVRETDQVLNSPFYVKGINQDYIIIDNGKREFELKLHTTNTLIGLQKRLDYLKMTADEIGSRPKLSQHIVTLGEGNPNGNGRLVSAGINPRLFKAARFKHDDVLVNINGFDVTNAEELEALQEIIPNAHALVFEVMRNGRTIKLYLDIPGEGLKVR